MDIASCFEQNIFLSHPMIVVNVCQRMVGMHNVRKSVICVNSLTTGNIDCSYTGHVLVT